MFLSFGRHFDLVNKRNDVIALVVVKNYLLRLIHVARSKTNTKAKWSVFNYYYNNNDTSVYGMLLDASQAFDSLCIMLNYSEYCWTKAYVL